MWCLLYFVVAILLISPLRNTYIGAVEIVFPGDGATGILEQEHIVDCAITRCSEMPAYANKIGSPRDETALS